MTVLQEIIEASKTEPAVGYPVLTRYCDETWQAYWSVIATSFLLRSWKGKGLRHVVDDLWSTLPTITKIACMYYFTRFGDHRVCDVARKELRHSDNWHLRVLSARTLQRRKALRAEDRNDVLSLADQFPHLTFYDQGSFCPWRGMHSKVIARRMLRQVTAYSAALDMQ